MKMLSVEVNDSLVKTIDDAVKRSGLYSSRSEFLKDAIRKNLLETLMQQEGFAEFHAKCEKMRAELKAQGIVPMQLSRQERAEIADKYLKELQARSKGSKT